MSETPGPEFSRPVALEDLRGGLVRRRIEADAGERERLARRFGLQAIDSLTATVTVEQRNKGRMVVVEGSLDAAVTQTCVVTLEPLPRTVSERFSARLVTPDMLREAAIVDIDPASEQDDPEPIDGDSVDIGELAAQHLSLSLDPYPRAEGAELDAAALAPDDGPAAGPFAQLARLKPKP